MKRRRALYTCLAFAGLAVVIQGMLWLPPRKAPPKLPPPPGQTLTGLRFGVESLVFSADGKKLASGGGAFGSEGEAIVWDLADGIEIHRLTGFPQPVEAVAFSPDGILLATAVYGDSVSVWDMPTGRLRSAFTDQKPLVSSLTFSPDGQTLILTGLSPEIVAWDLGSGAARIVTRGEFGPKALSPDGSTLAMGITPHGMATRQGSEGRLVVLPLAIGESPGGLLTLSSAAGSGVQRSLDCRDRPLVHMKFSPDGRTLAGAAFDGAVRLWDTGPHKLRLCPEVDGSEVVCLAFSPDGLQLAGGRTDGKVTIWNVRTGAEITTLPGHPRGITALAFAPDGRRLASGGHDKTIRLWDVAVSAP